MRRVLLIGGTGLFGRRLARHLAGLTGIELFIASRTRERAWALAGELSAHSPRAAIHGVALDRDANLAAQLRALAPWVVIDASGPFQGADYRVPLAALAAGSHVLDLADARDYLAGYAAAVGPSATRGGLVALAGVSSTSALSTSVVAEVTRGWRRVDTVDFAITPDGRADVGAATVAGVLSYAGAHVQEFRYGGLRSVRGWMRARSILLPGLGWRRVAPVDTIDAALVSAAFGVRSRVRFSAGLQSPLEMRGLALLARLRSLGASRHPERLAPILQRARTLTRLFATRSGGMRVEITGLDADGVLTRAGWTLVAHDGDGPDVPGLASAAAVRLLLAGRLEPGARVVCGDIPLATIEAEIAPLAITTSRTQERIEPAPFARAVGETAWATLPEQVRSFHDAAAAPVWTGVADVDRGRHPLSRLVGRIVGLPAAARQIGVRVTIERERDGEERWTRTFGHESFHSTLSQGRDARIEERFGPLVAMLGLEVERGTLRYPVAGCRLLGVPLPRMLWPKSEAFETVDEAGRFRFDVRLSLPLVGFLAHYRGWLVPAEATVSGSVQDRAPPATVSEIPLATISG